MFDRLAPIQAAKSQNSACVAGRESLLMPKDSTRMKASGESIAAQPRMVGETMRAPLAARVTDQNIC